MKAKSRSIEESRHPLLAYLRSLKSVDERESFAARCGTTIGYLRKAISAKQPIREAVVIAIERESGGAVRCEELRPDVDWEYLRGSARRPSTVTTRKVG